MTDGIVNIIAHNLSRGESDFKVSRRLLSGENALLVEQGVFVATNEYYREYDCPCGNGTSMITRSAGSICAPFSSVLKSTRGAETSSS